MRSLPRYLESARIHVGAQLRMDSEELYIQQFGKLSQQVAFGVKDGQMLGICCFSGFGQDKNDVRTKLAHSFCQAVASCAEPSTYQGRKFPTEHKCLHVKLPYSLLSILS